MKSQQQSHHLNSAEDLTKNNLVTQIKPVQQVSLEEQNKNGNFIPYLILKDQLNSVVDSSGNTVLHHMCSYNSPYLTLFLSSIPDGDPILNIKSKLNHTPLDIASLYCNKQYVDLLKSKGAIQGNPDVWSVYGANLTNWSGKAHADKKELVYWAAYNDLPDVIHEYAKQGINISEPDVNGYTSIDLAILNKSYNSMRLLTNLGYRPNPQLIKTTDSQSIKQHFEMLNESQTFKMFKQLIKTFSLILFIALCLCLNFTKNTMILSILIIIMMTYIMLKPTKIQRYLNNNRKTQFTSQLLMNKIINRHNHLSYLILHFAIIVCGVASIYETEISNHLKVLIMLILLLFIGTYAIHLSIQIFGICKNLTYDQMINSHKWVHLWEKVMYIQQRNILVRHFYNSNDRGTGQNIQDYFVQ